MELGKGKLSGEGGGIESEQIQQVWSIKSDSKKLKHI